MLIFPHLRACTRMEGEDVYGNKIKVELSNGKNGANGKNGGNGKNGKTLQNGGSSLKQEPRSTPSKSLLYFVNTFMSRELLDNLTSVVWTSHALENNLGI